MLVSITRRREPSMEAHEQAELEKVKLSFDEENAETPVVLSLKGIEVALSPVEAADLLERLYDYQDYFLELRRKALRMAGKVDEAISLLRRTDVGNKIGYKDCEKGPTRRDLFISCALNECSEEWLAEQLAISLAEVKKIGALWEEDFQEHTPETAQKLEEALIAVGCLPEEEHEATDDEEDHSELIERLKLYGIEHVPLQGSVHLVKMADDSEVHKKMSRSPDFIVTYEDIAGKEATQAMIEAVERVRPDYLAEANYHLTVMLYAMQVKPDGTIGMKYPANHSTFTLEELQSFVGGSIELVSFAPNCHVYINN